ncbi:MAG: sodium/solute symporter [Acidobacteriota bacterium]
MSSSDYLVIFGYFALVTATGVLCGRGQKSGVAYFLGNRSIHWIPAGITMVAVGVSTVSFIGMPGQSFKSNWTFLQVYLAIPIASWVVCRVFLPVYNRMAVTTAYEYLEHRFDVRTRLLASAVFQITLCGSTGVVIYAPSIILSEITGLPVAGAILLVGSLTTFYTMAGGVKGVIYTDILQAFVFMGGWLFAVWFIVKALPGGIGYAWSVAIAEQKLRVFDFSTDPSVPSTFWAGVVGMLFTHLALTGINQAQVQKFLTVSGMTAGRRAIMFYAFGIVAVYICFFGLGTLLFVLYGSRPGALPSHIAADQVFPYFITTELPNGIRGFLIAGSFSAAMSTVSSALNSLASATVVDFLDRWRSGNTVVRARLSTVLWGAVVTLAGLLAWRLGSILETIVMVNSYFYGCLLGTFLLGMLTKGVRAKAAIAGLLGSIATVLLFAIFRPEYWVWFGAIGCLACLTIGYAVSGWMHEAVRSGFVEPGVDQSLPRDPTCGG